MFSLIWRFFPGPAWLRIFVILIGIAAVIYALITFVYPAAAMLFVTDETTVES